MRGNVSERPQATNAAPTAPLPQSPGLLSVSAVQCYYPDTDISAFLLKIRPAGILSMQSKFSLKFNLNLYFAGTYVRTLNPTFGAANH